MSEEGELFKPLTRTERQKECLRAWVKHKCVGSIVATTGFGKTRCGIMASQLLYKQFPKLRIIVVVPSDFLQKQWISALDSIGLSLNSQVIIINTLIKSTYDCDLLILDECHRYASDLNQQVFTRVHYKYILGLSATMERLDGRHILFDKYCPVIDRISDAEAIANGWVAKSVEYKVILDVDDIDQYKALNKDFNEHFEFFGHDFKLAMSMIGEKGFVNRAKLRNEMCSMNKNLDPTETFRTITYHAMEFNRRMQERKKFINKHPLKIELTREIIKCRPNAKIITFSATTDIAESIGIGHVYTGKDSKKKGRATLDEFSRVQKGVLNTVKKCDEGLDCPGINTAIILGYDSSPTRYKQRKGRAIRKEGDKISEIFTFVINDTVENEWFKKSHGSNTEVIPIDVENLRKVLRGEPYETYHRPVKQFTFRF